MDRDTLARISSRDIGLFAFILAEAYLRFVFAIDTADFFAIASLVHFDEQYTDSPFLTLYLFHLSATMNGISHSPQHAGTGLDTHAAWHAFVHHIGLP